MTLRPLLKHWTLPFTFLFVPSPQEKELEQKFGVMSLSAQWQFFAALCALSSLPGWYPLYCEPILYEVLQWTLTAFIVWRCMRVWRGVFVAMRDRRRRRILLRRQGAPARS